MENIYLTNDELSRKQRAQISYQTALTWSSSLRKFARIPWVTYILTIGTIAVWCFTAYQVALTAGAHTFSEIIRNVLSNTENGDVLVTYGAKYNDAILGGQYWRFITPIFLHANLLHISLNMLNLFILGIFIERLFGHLRFLLIYLVTGVISVIASFYFAPQEISVGASGAIFGLVGAYSIFVLVHRRAFGRGGIPALAWLVFIIGINLALGLFISNVDNYAHVAGLLSGCILGWLFTPYYIFSKQKSNSPQSTSSWPKRLIDIHSLTRRWPLALLTIAVTLFLAIIALHFVGG